MDFATWVPSISITSLVGFVLWLSRNLIITRLTSSIRFEYDTKLEKLRSEFNKENEFLKNDLRIKESEINLLRSGALSAMANRQIEYDKRQLKAIDEIWGAVVIGLGPAKIISEMMVVIIFGEAAKEAEKSAKMREAFNTLGKSFDISKIKLVDASLARPYVSPMAWALFRAYSSIVMSAVIKLEILKTGVGAKFLAKDKILDIVKLALPEYSSFLDQYGTDGCHYLLDVLEDKLLKELQNIFTGVEADKASVERAADIIRHADLLLNETKNAAT